MKTKIIFFNKFLKIVFIFALTRKFFKHCPKNKMNLHTKKLSLSHTVGAMHWNMAGF